MKITLALIIILLSGCGGGDVVCSAAGACTVNTGAVTVLGVLTPFSAAVATPAASSPPAPPVA